MDELQSGWRSFWQSLDRLISDVAAQGFGLAAFGLAIEPFTIGTFRGLSGLTLFGRNSDAFD